MYVLHLEYGLVYVGAFYVLHTQCYMQYRQTLYSISNQLSLRFQQRISRSWVSRMYKRWRWSFKNVSHKHLRKYLWPNLLRYSRYLVQIRGIQQARIKFMDEASFSSRGNSHYAFTHYKHAHIYIFYACPQQSKAFAIRCDLRMIVVT